MWSIVKCICHTAQPHTGSAIEPTRVPTTTTTTTTPWPDMTLDSSATRDGYFL